MVLYQKPSHTWHSTGKHASFHQLLIFKSNMSKKRVCIVVCQDYALSVVHQDYALSQHDS